MNFEESVKALALTLLVQSNAFPEPTHFLSFAMRTSLWTKEKKSHTTIWFAKSAHRKRIPIAPASLLEATTFDTWAM